MKLEKQKGRPNYDQNSSQRKVLNVAGTKKESSSVQIRR